MSEQTAAFRKVFEYELLEAEDKVKFYRGLLGMPPVESNADYAKETKNLKNLLQERTKELDSLKRCIAQQKDENEVLHRKVNDLKGKLSQAWKERNKLRDKLEAAKGELSETEKETPKLDLYLEKLYQTFDNGSTGMFENPKGFWSGEGEPQEGELVFKSVAGTVRIVPFSKDDRLKE